MSDLTEETARDLIRALVAHTDIVELQTPATFGMDALKDVFDGLSEEAIRDLATKVGYHGRRGGPKFRVTREQLKDMKEIVQVPERIAAHSTRRRAG